VILLLQALPVQSELLQTVSAVSEIVKAKYTTNLAEIHIDWLGGLSACELQTAALFSRDYSHRWTEPSV
jgi:hypothetical protein